MAESEQPVIELTSDPDQRADPRDARVGVRVRRLVRRSVRMATDYLAYLFVRLLIAVIQTMPYDMGDAATRGIAHWISRYSNIRRRTTRDNLARVFPDSRPSERDALETAMWHNLLLMVCEIAWAQRRLHLTNWNKHIRFRRNRTVLQHVLSKRATVSVTGHFGNFELGGYTLGLMGCESTTIARRLDNPFLHGWLDRFRSAKGQRMIDKDGCAGEVEDHLDRGGALAILADQHAGPKGCWVNFLGVPASCHKALAVFSLAGDAPMMVGYTRRIDRKPMQFETALLGVADPREDANGVCQSVKELTKWYNRNLADAINLSVEQYWWLHRRWREPPEKIARRLARAA